MRTVLKYTRKPFNPADPERRFSLTGSSISTILGVSKYGAPKSFFTKRTRRDSTVLSDGHAYEEIIADTLRQTTRFADYVHNHDSLMSNFKTENVVAGTPDMLNEETGQGVEIKTILTHPKNLHTFYHYLDDSYEMKMKDIIEQPSSPIRNNNVFRMHLLQCVVCMFVLNWGVGRSLDDIRYHLVYYVVERESIMVFEIQLVSTESMGVFEAWLREISDALSDEDAVIGARKRYFAAMQQILSQLRVKNITKEVFLEDSKNIQ